MCDYNEFCKSFFIVDPIINNSHDGCMVIKLSTINELFENPINIRKDNEECVINFIKELINEKEFFVITHRYKLNDAEYMTYTELAKELGVSASRIKSIEERAKRIIRRSMPGLKECLLKQKKIKGYNNTLYFFPFLSIKSQYIKIINRLEVCKWLKNV